MKRILAFLLSIILVMPAGVFAAPTTDYTVIGIGDSIMAGYGVNPNEEFISLLGNEIQRNLGSKVKVNTMNLGINALDSTNLLSLLKNNPQFINDLKKANLIEINIGGNDGLIPLAVFIMKEMNIVMKPGDTDFFGKLNGRTAELLRLDYKKLQPTMIAQRDNFMNITWPAIISELKRINPSAKIVAVNTFNPFKGFKTVVDMFGPDFVNTIDIVTNGVNSKLASYASGRYEVVDIYKPFSSLGGVLLTNIIKTDPHPNKTGHQVIYALHRNALERYQLISKVNLNEPKVDIPSIGKITARDARPILESIKTSIKNNNRKQTFSLYTGGKMNLQDIITLIQKNVKPYIKP